MTDNIFKTFNEIADWLSNWRPGGRKDLVDVAQILRDPVWKQKRIYSTAVFVEFTLYLDLEQMSTDLSFSERREKSEKILLDILEDDIPLYPPLEHPLNENFDKFGNGKAYPLWNEIFAELLAEDYYIQQTKIGLQHHLWAVHLFYSDIIKRLNKISLSLLFRIDLAFALATGNACSEMRGIQIRGTREGDRTFKSNKTPKHSKKKQHSLDGFYLVDSEVRSKIGHYVLAGRIEKKLLKTGVPKKEMPSQETIVRSIRGDKRINPILKT